MLHIGKFHCLRYWKSAGIAAIAPGLKPFCTDSPGGFTSAKKMSCGLMKERTRNHGSPAFRKRSAFVRSQRIPSAPMTPSTSYPWFCSPVTSP